MSGERRAALAAFAVALLARLLHLLSFRELAYYRLPFGDSRSFAEEASRILELGPFAGELPYFQGPLYPLLLALVQGIGLPLAATYWIQMVTGALTVGLAALLAGRLAGARAALLAGILLALHDASIFFDGDLLAASPVATLSVLGLLLLTHGHLVPAGIALGLAVWGRPNLIVPVTLVIGLLAWRPGSVGLALDPGASGGPRSTPTRRAWVALALAAGLVVALPVARNLVVSGEPVLATGGGVNAYIGNHVGATGTFRIPPESGLANDLDLERISRQVASAAEGRELSPGESSSWWFRRTLRDVGEEPGAAVARVGRKALLVLSGREIPNHLDLDVMRSFSTPLRLMPVRSWLLLPLGIAGLVLLARTGRPMPAVWGLGVLVSVLPFFVATRFRMPAMPILAVGAGILIDRLGQVIRDRAKARTLTVPLVAGGVAMVVAWLPLLPPSDRTAAYVNLGALHAELGEPLEAEAAFREALARSPGDPRARTNLAILALDRNDPAEAFRLLDEAVRIAPGDFNAWSLRGIALGGMGRFDDGLASAERAVELHPGSESLRQNLAALWQDYVVHCQGVLAEAGFSPPTSAAERARQAAFLRDRGLLRAADRLLPRSGSTPATPPPDAP